jgi:tetratricopeptide (TPR) repeat protein
MPELATQFKSTLDYVRFLLLPAALMVAAAAPAQAQAVDEALLDIENRWAIAMYEMSGSEKAKALSKLLQDARAFAASHSKSPEAAAWHGIIARECTRARCRIGSKNLHKEARDALLKAEALDPYALDGRIYAYLGALYSQTSSLLGGFGSPVKGIGYLWRAIIVDPDGLDTNYLYAELLVGEKNLEEAHDVLVRASETPVRPGHLRADRGRQREILALLQEVEEQLKPQS